MEREFLEQLGLGADICEKILQQAEADRSQLGHSFAAEQDALKQSLAAAEEKLSALDGADIAALRQALTEEQEGRMADRRQFTLRAALREAGCNDVDYLLYKIGDTAQFKEDGTIKDKTGLMKGLKKQYAGQFGAPSLPTPFSGGNPAAGTVSGPEGMTYQSLAAYLSAHPDTKLG